MGDTVETVRETAVAVAVAVAGGVVMTLKMVGNFVVTTPRVVDLSS
jgi:hypothetical protein